MSTTVLLLAAVVLLVITPHGFVTVSELGGGAAKYFTEGIGHSHDYLSEQGRSSSQWHGAACDRIGVKAGAPVTREQFEALQKNLSPLDGTPLVQRQQGKNLKAGHDLTFGLPKSISVLGVLGTERARKAISQSSRDAIESTLALADSLTPRNRGKGGVVQERPPENGRVWALFKHDTNRRGELHTHYHCLTWHIGFSSDGSTGRTERRGLLDNQIQLGEHFRSKLEEVLNHHGFKTEKTVAGRLRSFRIRGFPEGLERALSTRTEEIEQVIKREGRTSPRAKELVTLRTRNAKRSVTVEELAARTRAICKAHGLDEKALKALCRGVGKAPQRTPQSSLQTPVQAHGGRAPRQASSRIQLVFHLLRDSFKGKKPRVLVGEGDRQALELNRRAQKAARTLGRLGLRFVSIADGRAFQGDRVRLRWAIREAPTHGSIFRSRSRRVEQFEHGTIEKLVDKRVFGIFHRRYTVVLLDGKRRTWAGIPTQRRVVIRAAQAKRALELGYATSRARQIKVERVRGLTDQPNKPRKTIKKTHRPQISPDHGGSSLGI